MSYVFRSHTTGDTNLKNWETSQILDKEAIRTIPDTIQTGISAKLGSSIPSPFARIYLFDAAFQIVANSNAFGNSMYHHLVSDCLDMFQFLFMFADSPDLSFQRWDREVQLKKMRGSAFDEHKDLADALDLFFRSSRFKDVQKIYLIYYKKKLVGGTSPLTGLYLSPNWRRIMKANGWLLRTRGDAVLFGDQTVPIQQRDRDFQLYIYKFIFAYNQKLAKSSEAFTNYFHNQAQSNSIAQLLEDNNLSSNYSEAQLLNEYNEIIIDPSNNQSKEVLRSNECAILKPQQETINNSIQQSDFLLCPTKEHYKKLKNEQGVQMNVPTPLLLLQGNHNLNYIESIWDEKTTVPDLPTTSLHKRQLPGSQYTYPYMTTGDFLEDVLIELPFKLDRQYFFSGFNGDFSFLLPIKKNYFNYFSLKDLEQQLTITQNENLVQVSLNLPIRGNRNLELRRSYNLKDDHQVVKQKGRVGFNIGIFPFYKITDQEELNKYVIGLVNNMEDLKIKLYKFDQIIHQQELNYTKETRTKGNAKDLSSTYYKLEKASFDCIELLIGNIVEITGLIIPKFKKVRLADANRQFTFAIDFGTTNTHIAYDTNRNKGTIHTFDITDNDRQMVLLSSLDKNKNNLKRQLFDGAGNLAQSIIYYDREFVPSFIEKERDTHYPIRTAVCEHESFNDASPQLFSNINIGFGLETNDSFSLDRYETNIKWMINNNRAGKPKERVEAFIHETLWLIKNKLLLNDGDLKTKIIWMVPLSMKRRIRNTFKDIWTQQVAAVFGENHQVELELKYESITPYYSLKNLRRSMDVVNIDIGGGTSDILFFCKKQQNYYSTSFRFAGNDIWGEGLSSEVNKENGFFQMIHDKIEKEEIKLDQNSDLLLLYHSFINTNLGSADICAFLFKYDDYFHFSDHVKNHTSLSTILFIHFSAIIYHIAQIIKTKDIEIPKFVSFTGKGSEYIKLMSSDENDIRDIVETLLEKFSGKTANNRIEVALAKNPKELTAEGAINQRHFSRDDKIDEKVQCITHAGFESNPALDPLSTFNVSDLDQISTLAKIQFNDFLNQLEQTDVTRLFKSFEINFKYDQLNIIDFLRSHSDSSFEEMKYIVQEDFDPEDDMEETLFFWFLKDTLYALSQELYKIQ